MLYIFHFIVIDSYILNTMTYLRVKNDFTLTPSSGVLKLNIDNYYLYNLIPII